MQLGAGLYLLLLETFSRSATALLKPGAAGKAARGTFFL